jgi:hypothetical protein
MGDPPRVIHPRQHRTGRFISRMAAVLALVLSVVALSACAGRPNAAEPATSTTNPDPRNTATSDASSLRTTAQAYVDAVNDEDEATARGFTCDQADAGVLFETSKGSGTERAIGESRIERGDHASVDIKIVGSAAKPVPLPFKLKNGAWCIDV